MEQQPLPPEVVRRLKQWYYWGFWVCQICHYALTIVGVVCSTLAATNYSFAKVAGVGAALCFAAIAAIQPHNEYRKYTSAWRVLDSKANLYQYGFIDLRELLDAMTLAEQVIGELEKEVIKTTSGSSTGSASQGTSP
jgi:hypothetical protein